MLETVLMFLDKIHIKLIGVCLMAIALLYYHSTNKKLLEDIENLNAEVAAYKTTIDELDKKAKTLEEVNKSNLQLIDQCRKESNRLQKDMKQIEENMNLTEEKEEPKPIEPVSEKKEVKNDEPKVINKAQNKAGIEFINGQLNDIVH